MIVLTSRKQIKICVYWKDETCSTFAQCWIGGAGKDGEGAVNRPIKTLELFLDFVWRHGWISPAQTIEHAMWWVYYKGKGKKENGLNGNELQPKISNDSS